MNFVPYKEPFPDVVKALKSGPWEFVWLLTDSAHRIQMWYEAKGMTAPDILPIEYRPNPCEAAPHKVVLYAMKYLPREFEAIPENCPPWRMIGQLRDRVPSRMYVHEPLREKNNALIKKECEAILSRMTSGSVGGTFV